MDYGSHSTGVSHLLVVYLVHSNKTLLLKDRLGQFTPSRTYETLLDGVTFTVQSKHDESSKGALDWLDAILNGNISIVNKVEVIVFLLLCAT